MKRIAVFGANGQLGKTLQSLVKGHIDDYSFFTRQEIDITDKKAIELVLGNSNFDFCVNCSAYTNVDGAETDIKKAFLVNATGVKDIAEACKLFNTKLIHISTDYVFDGKKQTPYKTDDITNPINQYGKSKLKGEQYIQDILKEYYIIRTSWLYSSFSKNFVKTIIKKIEQNTVLKITTEEKGTPTSCIDLSEFIIQLISDESIPYGIYNFTAKGHTTWYGFAQEIARNYNLDKINLISPTNNFKTFAKRPYYSILDISKTEIVYKSFQKWEKSLKIVVEKLKKAN